MPALFKREQLSRWNIKGRIEQRRARASRDEKIERVRGTAVKAAPWVAAVAAVGAAVAWLTRPARRNAIARGVQRVRHTTAKAIRRGRGSDEDEVLTERVRESIASLEADLGIAPIRVAGHDGEVEIFGSVGTRAAAHAIEKEVASVAGVRSVESHLAVGAAPSDNGEAADRSRRVTIGRLLSSRRRERHSV